MNAGETSTIVEIIRAYQPFIGSIINHYQSTIVEIIRAYQPSVSVSADFPSTIVEIIRAYQPTILSEFIAVASTIVEIIRAYQPLFIAFLVPSKSTIVEIIRAYQPLRTIPFFVRYLQQQKLLELTSQYMVRLLSPHLQQQKLLELTSLYVQYHSLCVIYNSRNYQSLLAFTYVRHNYFLSTIVEIIRAYQPKSFERDTPLLSTIVEIIRAYQPFIAYEGRNLIYNSRNYQSLLAQHNQQKRHNDLQQQKLLELTSPRGTYRLQP